MWKWLIVKVSVLLLIKVLIKNRRTIMNKTMILAILIDYKVFNDKSLTVVTDEYVVNFAVIDTINNDTVSLLSYANDDNYGRITINIDDITGIQFQK